MTAPFIDAYVLFSGEPPRCAAFDRALRLPLEEERHGDGPVHLACEFGPVHFAIYPLRAGAGEGGLPCSRLGLRVEDLKAAVAECQRLGHFVSPIERKPWGRHALVEDPDGRSLELNSAAVE